MRTRAKIEDDLAKVNARIAHHKSKIQKGRDAGVPTRFKPIPQTLMAKWAELKHELEACTA